MTLDDDDNDPTEVIRRTAHLEPVVAPRCTLTVVQGADAGKTFSIDDLGTRRILVGQSPACDVRLTDRTVSRRHAALELDAEQLHVVDLGSSNGTFVGGTRVRDGYVTAGAIVKLGETLVRINLERTAQRVESSDRTRFGRVIGASPEMRRLYPVFERIALAPVPVLIEGETGTGKEVLAESLHEASGRRGPFVVFDCTTVAPSLLEAELFGHERGAFTGADRQRIGLFEQAHGGTLFVDEIGDLDLALQAKLLRAIERGEIRRVGGNTLLRIDARIVAATRRDLDAEVQARRFRDDLFFRLAVARVELPPLRKRQGDIPLLARCFWTLLGGDVAQMAPDVIARFESYDWPGNVRELHNAVAQQLALGNVELAPRALREDPDPIARVIARNLPLPRAREEIVLELERRYLEDVLAKHGGHVGRAAQAAGVGRRYFQMLRNKQ